MKINQALIARSLIALLFVVAGYQKLVGFAGTVAYIGSLGVPLPQVATAIVIIIEILVALLFAYGYRICLTGWTIVAFTALTTVLVHHDLTVGVNLVMALKNIAIIGGIWAVIQSCDCENCKVPKTSKK